MNTLTNENFEKLPTEAQEQRLSGSHNNKLEPTAKRPRLWPKSQSPNSTCGIFSRHSMTVNGVRRSDAQTTTPASKACQYF
jgi:hypothetical protein